MWTLSHSRRNERFSPTPLTRHGKKSGNISIHRPRKCLRRSSGNCRAIRSPGSRYLFNVKSSELTKIAEVAPWLKENQLAPMRPIEYKSRDGLTIHGYLTLPGGRQSKNLP